MDDQNFILGRTYLIKYDILVDLRKWKLTIRGRHMENLEGPIPQVGNEPPVLVLVTEHVTLRTDETLMTNLQLECEKSFKKRIMLLTQKSELHNGCLFLGDSVREIGDDYLCWCSVKSHDLIQKLSLKMNLVTASTALVLEENLIEDSVVQDVVAKIDQDGVLSNSESEFILPSDNFLAGSECPLEDFSEFERERQLDQALLKPIPTPDLRDIKSNWATVKPVMTLKT